MAGKYRMERRLGTGGTGAVYLARDIRLERDVAIKILGEVSVSRLMGLKPEAWAMATVTHPGLAQIYGIETFRGRSFLVVEFLAGGTLADQLVRGPLPESQAVAIVTVLADALAALHESGYLHGDVKPSNIGFTSKGSPKLLDFGLAQRRRMTPPWPAARCGIYRPRCFPVIPPGNPTISGRCAWSCMRWCWVDILSRPTASATWRTG